MADLNKYISDGAQKVKLHEVRELVHKAEASELKELRKDCELELLALRTRAVVQPLENPMRVRHVRKLIARINTELGAREAKAA